MVAYIPDTKDVGVLRLSNKVLSSEIGKETQKIISDIKNIVIEKAKNIHTKVRLT